MLKIRNVNKNFGRIAALRDVNLDIAEGEFFALLGPNGAGKSTLMDIIVGYTKADSGSITVKGEMMGYEALDMRKMIGYIPQEISLYQELTATENLVIFGNLYNISGNELNTQIEKVLDLVKLSDRAKDKVKTFSGGMKRRLNLAASILHNPSLILCDEPTVGVDPQSRNAIFEMLQQLNKSGITILYTTHYMEEAERLCSKIAIIDNGSIVADGTLSALLNKLEKRNSIKITKPLSEDIIQKLESSGELIAHDYFYEFIPDKRFNNYSEVFKLMEDVQIPSDAVSLTRASLEDVFLQLTGRNLRD